MSVVDETSRVAPLDEAALGRLTIALDRPEVLSAFLFGSQARGGAGPLSDVDVAILHREPMSADRRLDLRLALMALAGAALGTDEIDLVLLNGAPALLRDRVLRYAVVLIDREPAATLALRRETALEYAATESERQELSRRIRRRLREGSFGRRP
jgi:hypothetical protein